MCGKCNLIFPCSQEVYLKQFNEVITFAFGVRLNDAWNFSNFVVTEAVIKYLFLS